MRCLNHTTVSGEVLDRIMFASTSAGVPACGFMLAVTSYRPNKRKMSTRVKINVYGDGLVELCKSHLVKGLYLVVEGELMNREGQYGDLTEVRALQLIFPGAESPELPEGDTHG